MKKLIQNKLVKRVLILAFLLIFALVFLHILNLKRLEFKTFKQSAQALIERYRCIQEQARPGYQAEVLSKLPPNPVNGTYYRLDDLLGEAVLCEKPSAPPKGHMSDVRFSLEFENANRPGIRPVRGQSTYQVKNGILRIAHDGSDFLMNEDPIQIQKDEVGYIVIRARVSKGTLMKLAWNEEIKPAISWLARIDIYIIDHTNFHTYVINAKNALKRGLKTGDKIKKIFLLPSDADGAIIEIDFIRFISKWAKYCIRPNGVDYETIDKELRRVLYMLPPQTLKYRLNIPKRFPILDFGIGILIDNESVNFEVSISDDHREAKLFTKRLTNSSAWHDVRLDLSQWAGNQVELSLHVSGSLNNVAFWSNPFLSSEPNECFNVIVILEDALRSDHLSTYGYKLPTSPVRDSLFAEKGIILLNAISQATWTRASVPSLMTSLLPTVTGVWHWSDMLREEYLTLAEIMRSQGFMTASFIQNENVGLNVGLHQGFSQVFDYEIIGGETEGIFGGRLSAWLEHHRRNFFLYIHIRDPHGPYDPPVPFDRWYHKGPSKGKPVKRAYFDPKWVEKPTLEGRRLLYDGEICHNDAILAGFLKKIKSLKIDQNTLLIFISDHGEHLGEHGLWDHLPPGFIQTISVPLIFVYPARFRKSKNITQMVQLIDVMPTILKLAQIDTRSLLLQGDSLIDLIESHKLSYWENRILVSEEPLVMSKKDPEVCGSLFFHDWHVISSKSLWRGAKFLPASLRTRIYNLRNDREETRMIPSFLPDFIMKYKFVKVMDELKSNNIATWKKWTGGQGQAFRLDPDRMERLRAFGYIK